LGSGVKVSVPSGLSTSSPIGSPLTGSLITTGVPGVTLTPLICVISSGWPSGSLSLVSGLKVTGWSSWPRTLSFWAMGGSLEASTTMLRVAVSVPPLPSETV